MKRLAILAALFLIGCDGGYGANMVEQKTVSVKVLSPSQYAYHADSGFWFYNTDGYWEVRSPPSPEALKAAEDRIMTIDVGKYGEPNIEKKPHSPYYF